MPAEDNPAVFKFNEKTREINVLYVFKVIKF